MAECVKRIHCQHFLLAKLDGSQDCRNEEICPFFESYDQEILECDRCGATIVRQFNVRLPLCPVCRSHDTLLAMDPGVKAAVKEHARLWKSIAKHLYRQVRDLETEMRATEIQLRQQPAACRDLGGIVFSTRNSLKSASAVLVHRWKESTVILKWLEEK